jgi:7-carboxy-7-deazaguanine synthase
MDCQIQFKRLDGMTLLVNEIFFSIQGESTWAGLPFVFIRLTGCNLRCRYCDTRYAYAQGERLEVDDVLQKVAAFACPRVTITGGEPLVQDHTPDLAARLLEKGYRVTLETNGSLDIGSLDRRCIRIMDIKCPSSGMHAHNRMSNLPLLGPQDQVKFVLADKADFQFALEKLDALGSHVPPEHILFSPAYEALPADRLAGWMLEAHVEARLQVQLHKYLWPDVEKGV